MVKFFSFLLLLFTFQNPCHFAFSSHNVFDLAFEIAEEYKSFKGHHIPNLSEQPCLAVQFVTFLKEDFKNNKDDKTAKKISMIIGHGIGVGGISDRIATREEENLIFSAICTIAEGRTDSPERHFLSFADMSPEQQTATFIQDNLSPVSSIYYYEYQNLNHSNHLLVCQSAYVAAIESSSILNSFDFIKDKNSLNYFQKSFLYDLILNQNTSSDWEETFNKIKSFAKGVLSLLN